MIEGYLLAGRYIVQSVEILCSYIISLEVYTSSLIIYLLESIYDFVNKTLHFNMYVTRYNIIILSH